MGPQTEIEYCENSTITEAWALVTGLPARFDETDAHLLARRARDEFPGLKDKPAIVAVNAAPELAQAFWTRQVTWAEDSYLARFGHRYLSVHFLRHGTARYEKFGQTLAQPVSRWLALYHDALGDSAARTHVVDRVAFGYVNAFEFDLTNFDLSKYFKLNFAVDVGTPAVELLGLGVSFRFRAPTMEANLVVDLSADPLPDSDKIVVITRVLAERTPKDGVSFAETPTLEAEVVAAKNAAKETFFGFTTSETQALMGAVNAADHS